MVDHMSPAYRYSYDEGLVSMSLGKEMFTISLEAISREGPVWYAEEGVFIRLGDDPETFDAYRDRHAGSATINQQVARSHEQSYAGAYFGQPRPHAVAYSFGCKHSPQRYWLEPTARQIRSNSSCIRWQRA